MRYLTRHLNYATVISLVAIVLALGGTSYAAMFTGFNIRNGSLTGLDVKNGSIERRDLSATTILALTGRKGATGALGERGNTGPQGFVGDAGDAGASAHSLVRYATYVSEYIRSHAEGTTPNGGTPVGWDAINYLDYPSESIDYPNFTQNFSDAEHFPVEINNNEPVLVQLTGNNHTTTGTIRPTSSGLLTATATLTILHQNHGQADHAGGLNLHGRIRCTLRYANNGQAVGPGSPKLGASEWLSSRANHKLYTIVITGSETVPADSLANYNVGVSCVDVDRTGSAQWMFTAGNITAHSVYIES